MADFMEDPRRREIYGGCVVEDSVYAEDIPEGFISTEPGSDKRTYNQFAPQVRDTQLHQFFNLIFVASQQQIQSTP